MIIKFQFAEAGVLEKCKDPMSESSAKQIKRDWILVGGTDFLPAANEAWGKVMFYTCLSVTPLRQTPS